MNETTAPSSQPGSLPGSPPASLTQPPEERSALQELEELAEKIQLSRRQREQKVAEFDAFVRAFRHERYASSIAASERELRRAEDRPAVMSAATHAARAVTPPTADIAVAAPVVVPPVGPGDAPWGPTAASKPILYSRAVGPLRPRAAHIGVTLAALAAVFVAAMVWRSAGAPDIRATERGPSAAMSAAPTSQAPTSAAPGASTPAPAAAIPAVPPRPLNVELVTVRPVWARVTVDGRRVMEREFKTGERFPFGANRAVAVRAGDAGAIRLVVDGKDLGVLGRDGQVFDRVFTPQTPGR